MTSDVLEVVIALIWAVVIAGFGWRMATRPREFHRLLDSLEGLLGTSNPGPRAGDTQTRLTGAGIAFLGLAMLCLLLLGLLQ